MSQTGRTVLIVTLSVGALLCGLGSLCAGFVGLIFVSAEDQQVDPADYPFLITATHLAGYLDHWAPDERQATTSLVDWFDGSVELEYEYEDDGFYLLVGASNDIRVEDAELTYSAYLFGEEIGMASEPGMRIIPSDQLFSWGDESSTVTYFYDAEPVGNRFIGRLGTKVYYASWAGVYFDEAWAMEELLRAAVTDFERW